MEVIKRQNRVGREAWREEKITDRVKCSLIGVLLVGRAVGKSRSKMKRREEMDEVTDKTCQRRSQEKMVWNDSGNVSVL